MKIPAGYRSIDGQGRYIMPGLITHVHVFGSGRRLSSNMGIRFAKTLKHLPTVLGRAMIRRPTAGTISGSSPFRRYYSADFR